MQTGRAAIVRTANHEERRPHASGASFMDDRTDDARRNDRRAEARPQADAISGHVRLISGRFAPRLHKSGTSPAPVRRKL